MTALNKWYNSYDQGINIDIVYTDISKAFDTVSHHKLLAVLESYGIVNKTLNWIQAFLSDRTQCVCINNAFLSFLPVTSGVPQGSVLGPLLFIIFINNMSIFCHPKHPLSGMLLYADDAKLFSTDHIDLQESITNINSWMDSYQLSIAPAKCQHLPIVCHPNNDNNQYRIGNNIISTLSAVSDLGIIVSSNLKWHKHICNISLKASIRCYQILHCFSSNNVWILLKTYITYIRPLLEYNTVLWSPYLKNDIAMIESVQKHYTKKICFRCNIPNTSYSHRLHMLNIKSLECKRLEFDLFLTYKIIHGIVDINFSDFFSFGQCGYDLRRHSFAIKPLTKPSTDHLLHFFSHRVPRVWNKLPESVVSAPTFTAFKKRLKLLI